MSRRLISQEIVKKAIDDGRLRYCKHTGKDAVAVPFFSLQRKKINGGCEYAPPELMALQFITVDGEPFPFTVDDTGKGKNKVFQAGSTHEDGFFQAGIDFNQAVLEGRGLVIVEGVIDALSVAQAVPDICCLATGSTSYTKKLSAIKPHISKLKSITIFQDNDAAGEKFATAAAGIIDDNFYKVQWLSTDKAGYDANDLLKSGQADRIKQMIDTAVKVKAEQPAAYIKPIVKMTAGRQPEIIKECEKILLDTGGIYQRGKNLFRISKEKRKIQKGICQGDAHYLQEVTPAWLRNRLNQLVRFTVVKDNKEISKDCTKDLAESILANSGEWSFPFILGISETPTLRLDGSIIQKSGYDPETGLYMAIDDDWNIPEHPTKQDAIEAYNKLEYVIKDFEFTDEESKTAVISAILTGVTRRLLPSAPAFCFDAPKRGSGKTLLANTIGGIITGDAITTINHGSDEAEFSKRIDSILFRGDPVINIDNIEIPVAGDTICSILTNESHNPRILGKSEQPKVETNILIMFTGNNVCFKGDMVRRVLISRIDPKCSNPEERTFTVDIKEYSRSHRKELVTAALTIIRAYHAAGRPNLNIPNYGSFETWCRFARNPLVWIEKVDPCKSREKVKDSDPVSANLKELLEAWHGVYRTAIKTAKEVAEDVRTKFNSQPRTPEQERLIDIVEVIAVDNNGIVNNRRLGNFIAKYRDRFEGNFRFVQAGEFRRVQRYIVEKKEVEAEEQLEAIEQKKSPKTVNWATEEEPEAIEQILDIEPVAAVEEQKDHEQMVNCSLCKRFYDAMKCKRGRLRQELVCDDFVHWEN